ncbi:MAG: UxaA family hydrolase [Casimicrobiaceae bacterium]
MLTNPSARVGLPLQATVLDPRDDVATALVDLAAGTRVLLGVGDSAREVVTLERIAAGHKFALRPLAAGEAMRKYGEIIGCATQAVAVGAWVHVHNLAPDTEERKVGAVVGAEVDLRSGASVSAASATKRGFDGYRRRDGRVGVRNQVLVLSPTGLTSAAARRIASLVRGTVCVASGYGRGQIAADAQLHFDTLAGLATHPNVAAVVVVSAGADITGTYVDAIVASGKPAFGLSLPGVNEDALALVDAGVRVAARLVHEASALRRERCDLADLCIAVECGHSDATSGLVCNPLAGRMMQSVVEGGGQAMFSETVEWTGAEHLLARRAVNADVARRIVDAVGERERLAREAGGDLRAQNPGPQNKAGGITTLEEKALGAIAKGGGQPIRDVLRAAQRPSAPGLYLMDTPYFSPESMTAMVAGGAQIVVFTTGAGNSYTSLIAPTLKMSANPGTTSRLEAQIDFAASGALQGTSSLDELCDAGVARLLEIASGSLTYGEIVGEGDEVVSRVGPSM